MHPGHRASYVIWVWSTHGTSRGVSVRVDTGFARHVDAPHFTVCPNSGGSTCSLGELTAGRADELQAASRVQRSAASGEQILLKASASGRNARSFNASGTIEVVTASTTPTPTPTTTLPGTGASLPPVTLPPVTSPDGSGANGLFPTVSPSPGSSSSGTSGGGVTFPSVRKQNRSRASDASAIVPLDPRLIGGQLAGLAVLLGAIVIAITRLSLRKPQTQAGPDSAKTDSTEK